LSVVQHQVSRIQADFKPSLHVAQVFIAATTKNRGDDVYDWKKVA
jgi:hypothetical protein